MSLRKLLRGTGVAIVTPFDSNLNPDFKALQKLINFLIAGKVDYLVVLGTTGEAPVLSREEKHEIFRAAAEFTDNRVPLVAGIGGNNTRQVADDLLTFPLESATAVLSVAPYYSKPSQEGLFEHYRVLAAASPLPLILYNVPGRTGRNMEASTVLKLARECKNIAGIKEASGDMQQCINILSARPDDFLVVSGDDVLALPQMACGMDGVISVAANAFPAIFSDMIRFCLEHDFTSAKILNDKLTEAYHLMFAENNPAGIKAFLHEMNMVSNVLRLPLLPLSEKFHRQVKKYLEEHHQCSY